MDRILCVLFCIVVIVVAVCVLTCCGTPDVEPPIAETLPTVSNVSEFVTEPTETTVPATEPTEPPVVLYDIPLAGELQLHIINEAKKRGIDPLIIFAMAYRESSYNANIIGDGGDSFGLLQIQPMWHKDRMKKLGCTDLLDPYQNVIVGVDYLCEQLNRYGDIAKALTAYNQGHYYGAVTQYAKNVLATAEQIKNERSQ